MSLKRLHIIPLALAFIGFGLLQQAGEPSQGYSEHLGFSLLPGANSRPVTFLIIQKFDDPAKPLTAVNITQQEFVGIAYGWGDSKANPAKEDLFKKYGVVNCGYRPDTIIHHVLVRGDLGCSPVDDLWKLSHSEWPFQVSASRNPDINQPSGPGAGWARNPNHPSDGQMFILSSYGITHFTEAIYGEKAFQLLRDMQDPAWVSTYAGS